MKKFTVISLACLSAVLSFVGCNSSSSNTYDIESAANVAINSFKLSKDDSIIANLDTVFFSIDLNDSRIFNADSLPYGTRTNKLVPRIVPYSSARALTVTDRLDNGRDSIHDYLANPGDTINFANGPVYIDITSGDGSVSMRYTVTVNVHQVVSDTLVWDRTAWRTLPTELASPVAQRTASNAAGVYCLTQDAQGAWCMAFAENPAPGSEWTSASATLPANSDINTFCASDDALFILAGEDADKTLWTSPTGENWTSTGEILYSLYGGFGSDVLGCSRDGDTYRTVSYPSNMQGKELPEGMPVEGASLPVIYSTPLGLSKNAVIIGGVKADGSLSNATWGYDGTNWACLSTEPLPEGMTGMVLVPFYVTHINNLFVPTEYSVLLAFGGKTAGGVNSDVYISYYKGMTWSQAQDYLQLPSFVPAVSSAQGFVYDTTMYPRGRGVSEWTEVACDFRIPVGVTVVPAAPASRATQPVSSWECPFIYVFGGVDGDGQFNNSLWRATINRLQFEPIQ